MLFNSVSNFKMKLTRFEKDAPTSICALCLPMLEPVSKHSPWILPNP